MCNMLKTVVKLDIVGDIWFSIFGILTFAI